MAYYFLSRDLDTGDADSLDGWAESLEEVVQRWRGRWYGDAAVAPRLYLRQEGDVAAVVDTRAGSELTFRLTATGLELLQLSMTPVRISKVSGKLGYRDRDAIDSELAKLAEHGLVFRENDTMLSLVFAEQPSDPFYRSCGVSRYRSKCGGEGQPKGGDRKSTRLNSSHATLSRMPSSA